MKKPVKKKEVRIRAYADVGSHGGIFYFDTGRTGELYPTLLHIFRKKVSSDLVPVTIVYNKNYKLMKRKAK